MYPSKQQITQRAFDYYNERITDSPLTPNPRWDYSHEGFLDPGGISQYLMSHRKDSQRQNIIMSAVTELIEFLIISPYAIQILTDQKKVDCWLTDKILSLQSTTANEVSKNLQKMYNPEIEAALKSTSARHKNLSTSTPIQTSPESRTYGKVSTKPRSRKKYNLIVSKDIEAKIKDETKYFWEEELRQQTTITSSRNDRKLGLKDLYDTIKEVDKLKKLSERQPLVKMALEQAKAMLIDAWRYSPGAQFDILDKHYYKDESITIQSSLDKRVNQYVERIEKYLSYKTIDSNLRNEIVMDLKGLMERIKMLKSQTPPTPPIS